MTPHQLAKLTLDDIWRTEGLTRWHMVRMKRPQSLAEHSFKVLLLAIKIANKLPAEDALVASSWVELFSYAIAHDLDELDNGDTPTPTKLKNPEIWAKLSIDFWNSRGLHFPIISGKTIVIIKTADLFEAWQYYRDYGYNDIDSGGELILRGCRDRFINYTNHAFIGNTRMSDIVPDLIDITSKYPFK